ncbi:tetratricopeptide repeat protein [Pendulispora rubella]|uniref:Tetratricopeptide repeat protein n=1 Tax=Pendulispora rubella TaxID=2741070 RepID=A0ABZ2KX08_9BACT
MRRLLPFLLASAALATSAGCRTAQSSRGSTDERSRAAELLAAEPIVEEPLPRPKDVPPLRLTASDGTGLRLTRLKARAVLDEPLAYTEVRLAFENPENRTLEGRFEITLPPGATVSRFAMKIGESWQEAEMIEKARARVVYEDFLHRKQDPALLEQAAPNAFSARVFPIPARGTKEILVAYAQELAPGAGYVFPLAGLPAVDDFDVIVSRAGDEQALQTRKRRDDAPLTEDVVVAPASLRRDGVRSGRIVLARVRPFASAGPEPFEGGTVVLVDTSASRALGFADQAALVEGLAREIASGADPSARLVVAAFDQDVESIYDGNAAGYGTQATAKLIARGALGASNLEDALSWVAKNAHEIRRVVVVSDGVATAGSSDGEKLSAAAARLRDTGVQRLDAVAVGGIRDDAALARLTSGALPHDGVVVDGARDAHALAKRLTRTAQSGLTVQVEGATWVWPERLDGVQPGDERLVYAEVPEESPVRIRIGQGAPTTAELRNVDAPLLEHTWAQAKIASVLAHAEGPKDDVARRRVIELSTRHRVLSPYTSLLVLETDADYARFDIDRKAPGNLLAIRDGRVTLEHRGEAWLGKNKGKEIAPSAAPRATGTVALDDTRAAPAEEFEKKSDSAPPPRPRPHGIAGGHGSATGTALTGAPDAPSPPQAKPSPRTSDADDPWGPAAPSPAPSTASPAPPAAPSTPPREDGVTTMREEAPMQRPMRSRSRGPVDMGMGSYDGDDLPARKIHPYTGNFGEVMDAIAHNDAKRALETATRMHDQAPGDVMSLVALGEALEARGDVARAARSYGSLIDLFPSRADLRRFAGERLERLRSPGALELAIDTYFKAKEERPDHPASHRLLAFAHLRKGNFAEAFAVAAAGAKRRYPEGRFAGVERILREDLGLIAAAWMRAEPDLREEITKRLREAGGTLESRPSLRFVLNWETDANDVDFHIFDARGGHAFYQRPQLGSGGELYADVTTGYGPECFTIRAPRSARAAPYKLQAHYYSRGPMGYGMGKLEILDHDGRGNITFEERPFVVMADQAFVDLGTVK